MVHMSPTHASYAIHVADLSSRIIVSSPVSRETLPPEHGRHPTQKNNSATMRSFDNPSRGSRWPYIR